MIAFILAAGFGTRLRPITDHIPKALVPVCGLPLLGHSLDKIHKADCSAIGVNAHHLPEKIEEFRRVSKIPFTIFHETGFIRETGGALFFARDFLGSDETFCVYNGDVITDTDHAELCRMFEAADCDCLLFAKRSVGKGTLWYEPSTNDFKGATADVSSVPGALQADFISIAFYRRRFLDLLDAEDRSIKPVWMRAHAKNMVVKVGLLDHVNWITIDTPELLARAHFDVLDKCYSLSIPEGVSVDHDRKRAATSRVLAEAGNRIGNDVWLGTSALPSGSTIARSVVLEGGTLTINRTYQNVIITPWEEVRFV